MPQTTKAQNLPPKIIPFQIFQDTSNSKSSKSTSQNVAFPNQSICQRKRRRSKLICQKCYFSKLPTFANCKKKQQLESPSQNIAFPNLPRCLKQQKLKTYIPRYYLCFHFQDVSNSKSSKPLSQNDALQIFQDAKNNNSSKPSSQNAAFPNLPRCLKQQKLKT